MQIDNLKLLIVAGAAKVGPPLGPVLAPYYVNLVQFCKEFNAMSQVYNVDDKEVEIELPVKVMVFDKKTYKISIGSPNVNFILNSLRNDQMALSVLDIYSVVTFMMQQHHLSSLKAMRIFLGFLNSFNEDFVINNDGIPPFLFSIILNK